MSGGPHKNQMTWPQIVSNKLIKVLDSLLDKYIVFQRNREAGSTPRSNFQFFFYENAGIELESDRLILIIWSQISLFETDLDESLSFISIIQQAKNQNLWVEGEKNFPPGGHLVQLSVFFFENTHTSRWSQIDLF